MSLTIPYYPTPFEQIPKPYRTKPITEIVVHGSGGGGAVWGDPFNERSWLGWMHDASIRRNVNGRATVGDNAFHYAIGRQGQIAQFLDDNIWCMHSQSRYHDEETIGVELLNSRYKNRGLYTIAQYKVLSQLIVEKFLVDYPGITIITGHRKNTETYSPGFARDHPFVAPAGVEGGVKNCPGRVFDWSLLKKLIENHQYGITITTD